MSGRDDDRDWSDERIRAAYRRMASRGRAPDDALSAAFAEMATDAAGRPSAGSPRRLQLLRRTIAGLAAVLVIVCVVGAVLLQRGATAAGTPQPSSTAASTGGPRPSSTATTDALPTMTVSQALRAIAAGGLTNTDLLAVSGWIQPSVPLRVSCPTFTVEDAFGVGSRYCRGDVLTLTETADPGSNLAAVVLAGTTLPAALTPAPDHAVAAVLVGHVNDLRASLCSSAAKAACAAAFVVDQVRSLDGTSFGPSVATFKGDSTPNPKLSPAQVSSAVGAALQPGSTVVSLTAVTLIDAQNFYTPGFGPSGEGASVFWYVRVAGPPPLSPLMPGARAGSGLLVLNDATGAIHGGTGWGWDPAKAGVTLADGTVTLHTTNWLNAGVCAGVGLEAVLRGSKDDPRVAWLEIEAVVPSGYTGSLIDSRQLVWPAGYRARFTPNVEIVDGSGAVMLGDGDYVGGACDVLGSGSLYLEPPFR